MKNIYIIFILLLFLCHQSIYGQWTSVELPAAPGGAVNCLAVKGTKLFAGKKEGIYVSDDNGLNWIKLNLGLPARYTNPNLLSIVTTDEYIVAACADEDVHISRDDGETWISQGLINSARTTPYIVAADRNWIICGQILGHHFNGQSTNAGQNWAEYDSVPRPIFSAAIQDSIALVGSQTGIFRSFNYGSDWNKVYDMAVDWNDPLPIAFTDHKVYIGVSQYEGNGYILSSPDSGVTWSYASDLPCRFLNTIIGTPSEADSQFIFAATDSGIFRSSDDCQNWIRKNNGLESKLSFTLVFKTEDTNETPSLYAGTSTGIYISSDYGDTWTALGSPADWLYTTSGSDIYALSSEPLFHGNTKYNYSIANTGYKTGIIYSGNNGSGWNRQYSEYLYRNSQITSFVLNENHVLFAAGSWFDPFVPGRKNSIVFVSDNYGSEWETIYVDSSTYTPVLGAVASDVYMNTVSGDLSRFSDDGNNRETLHPVLSPIAHMDTITNPPVSGFTTDENKIYLSGSSMGHISGRPPIPFIYDLIAYSEDDGQNWTRVASPLDSITFIENEETDTLSRIAEIYPDGNHILVGLHANNFSGYPWQPSYGGGFFHLFFDGTNWIIADTAFVNTSVFAFSTNGSTIFMGSEKGVYSTNDYGASWEDISTGMGSIYVKDLFVTDDYLFASTSNGLWQRPLSEITFIGSKETGQNSPQEIYLSQNYPNPFNPATTINYRLNVKSHVELIIYDIAGRKIKTLVDQAQNRGKYSINFNASGLASGVYVYRLKAGSTEQSRKMLLLR